MAEIKKRGKNLKWKKMKMNEEIVLKKENDGSKKSI